MSHFTLLPRSADDFAAIITRAEASGSPVERRDDGALVVDPAGNCLLLMRATTTTV
jgi:hypothetical protein